MAKHKVITTDKTIDRALERAKQGEEEPRVVEVCYNSDARFDLFVFRMSDGARHIIGREKLQGLQHATKKEIANVEIVGNGTGLHWPELDLDLYVPHLLGGQYGNQHWMAEIGRRGGQAKSGAKVQAAKSNGLKGGRPRKAVLG